MSNEQSVNKAAQREPVEVVYAAELDKLRSMDHGPVPPGWLMSPRAVEKFVMGDERLGIERKFVADRAMVVRIIISLCTSRGCLLPPGAAGCAALCAVRQGGGDSRAGGPGGCGAGAGRLQRHRHVQQYR